MDNADHQPSIKQLVDALLADNRVLDSERIEKMCQEHPTLGPGLHRALLDAMRTRDARLRAELPPSEEKASATSDNDDSAKIGMIFGRFVLGAKIGAGGFGEVYAATMPGAPGTFAVKLLRREHGQKADALQRFRREAEILQNLDHPGVVRVIEIGEEHGHLFIGMEYGGQDLHRYTRAKPIAPELAARLVADAADACRAAHQQRIVHRDIKPENLLIDEAGRVRVSDFGLAKQLDATEQLTHSLQRLGTLHYMAPEQADRRLGPTTHKCDVYSLGATLYFLLTGVPPFPTQDGLEREATLDEIKWNRPKPLSEYNSSVPPDLERLCLQCLEKRPVDRCADAAALAAELRNFVAKRPLRAALPSKWGRTWRWCSRRPVTSALLGVAASALIVGSAASLYYALIAEEQKGVAAGATAREKTTSGERHKREYLADMRDAQGAFDRGDTQAAKRLLAKYENPNSEGDPRAFEWRYLNRVVQNPSPLEITRPGRVWNRISLSPTGDRLACIDQKGILTVFGSKGDELFTGATALLDCEFTPDGTSIVGLTADYQGSILLMNSETGVTKRERRLGALSTVLAVHPDGNQCFIGNIAGDLFLYNLATTTRTDLAKHLKRGQFDRSSDIQHEAVTAATFSNDGKLLAVGYSDGATQVWEIEKPHLLTRGPEHTGPVLGLSFSFDTNYVASQSYGRTVPQLNSNVNGEIEVWGTNDGNVQRQVVPHPAMPADSMSSTEIPAVTLFGKFRPFFSADGRDLITTGPQSVLRWSIASGRILGQFPGSGSLVYAVASSRDGRFIASAEAAGSARVWSAETPDPVGVNTVFSAIAGIRAMAVQGSTVVALVESGMEMTRGREGERFARTWRRAIVTYELGDATTQVIKKIESTGDTFAVTALGIVHGDSLIEPHLEAAANTLAKTLKNIGRASCVAVSPDCLMLAYGGNDGTVGLIQMSEGKTVWSVTPHQGEVTALAFSVDGLQLASGGIDRRIYLLNCQNGEEIGTMQGHHREVGGLCFSPDGTRLASSSGLLRFDSIEPGEVCLWDVGTQQLCLQLRAGSSEVYTGVAWSSDSTRLFAAANPISGGEGRVDPGRILEWSTAPPTVP